MCTRLMLLNYQSKVGSLGYMYTILSEHCHLAHALGSIYTNIYTTIRLVISVMKQTCVSQPSVFTFLLTLPVVSVLWHLFFVNDYGH